MGTMKQKAAKFLLQTLNILIYSKLTYTFLLKGEQKPECILCHRPLSIHHLFLEFSGSLPSRNLLLNNVRSCHLLLFKKNYAQRIDKYMYYFDTNPSKFDCFFQLLSERSMFSRQFICLTDFSWCHLLNYVYVLSLAFPNPLSKLASVNVNI